MNREKQIEKAAEEFYLDNLESRTVFSDIGFFVAGAEWADKNLSEELSARIYRLTEVLGYYAGEENYLYDKPKYDENLIDNVEHDRGALARSALKDFAAGKV